MYDALQKHFHWSGSMKTLNLHEIGVMHTPFLFSKDKQTTIVRDGFFLTIPEGPPIFFAVYALYTVCTNNVRMFETNDSYMY